jgi:hypothetical protein
LNILLVLWLIRTRKKIRLLTLDKSPTPSASKTLFDERQKLRQYLTIWRGEQFELFPQLREHIGAFDPSKPELEPLFLPSSFSQPFRTKYGLDSLAKVEYGLREGRAHDALDDVRTSIKVFNYNLDIKKNIVHGQRPNTRAQDFLRTLTKDKISGADKYRTERMALLALGLLEDDQVLQPLHDDQLWAKDASRPARLGDSRKENPWFWHVGRPSGLTEGEDKEWDIECT